MRKAAANVGYSLCNILVYAGMAVLDVSAHLSTFSQECENVENPRV